MCAVSPAFDRGGEGRNFLAKGRESMHVKRYLAAVSTVAVLGLTGVAGTATAQTNQTGLVNISATNTTIQVPISVAANLCNISLAIIAAQRTGPGVPCTALSTATTGPVTVGGPAGPT